MTDSTHAESLISSEIKLSHAKFIRTLIRLKGLPWIIGLTVVCAASIALTTLTNDLRWLFLLPLAICLVAPSLLLFLYFTYALSPGCLPLVHTHRVQLTSDSILVHWQTIHTSGEETQTRTHHLSIPYLAIKQTTPTLHSLLITFEKPFGFLLLPYDTLPDPNSYISNIYSKGK